MDSEMTPESPSFAEETASNMLKELQSWWEIPSMAQYISLFREAFNLPEIEIEELENGLIDDCIKGPNEWLQNLVIAFLKTIMPGRVNPTNWEIHLRRLIRRKWSQGPFVEKENPFAEDKSFQELTLRSKVEVLYCFCLYRLDNNDITEVMKSMDAEALRVQKLGFDDANNTYWYFYGTRLYKEEPLEEKKTWDEEWMEQKWNALTGSTEKRGRGRPPKTPKKQNVENNAEDDSKDDSIVIVRGRGRPRKTPRKENVEIIVEDDSKNESFTTIVRGRGRPRKTPKKEDVENNVEDDAKDDRFMNVSEKSRWSVVCDTLEEWVNFTEKFKDSKSKNEKSLFTILQENFLPILNKIYEEKERKLQEKIRALLPEEPVREKIVTRRDTRRMRGDTGGDVNYAALNGDDSDEEYRHRNDDFKMTEVKSRAERLEERKKRAVGADVVQYVGTHKRVKHNEDTKDSSESSQNSTSVDNSDGNEIDLMSQMVKLLSSVKLHKDAWPFLYPVNEDDAPGYYEIIKDPVDLSAIESKLYKGDYETIGDLDEDFSKMVSNCELYNGENHAYSKMAQTLRKMFRKEVANLLEMLETVDSSNGDSEESIDSQYHSSSNSSSNSPPHEPPVVESKEHKKVKSKKKKRKHGNQEALDLLAQATDIAVQNSNEMLNISNMYQEQKMCNDFPNLKILPIHSHPPSFIEKYSSNSSQGNNSETDSLYSSMNEKMENDGHYLRSSPTDSAISSSSEAANYVNNLTQFANFIEKDSDKNFNILSNSDVNSVLQENDSNNSNSGNASSFPKNTGSSGNLHSVDNILDAYPENFISQIMKHPIYNTNYQGVLQNKSYEENFLKLDMNLDGKRGKSPNFPGNLVPENKPVPQNKSSYEENFPKFDMNLDGKREKSPNFPGNLVPENKHVPQNKSSYEENFPKLDMNLNGKRENNLHFAGHTVPDNTLFPDAGGSQYNPGSPSDSITTIDASVLGISLYPWKKKLKISGNSGKDFVRSEKASSENGVHLKDNHSFKSKQTPPHEMNQLSSLNSVQTISAPVTSYQPLNFGYINPNKSLPATFIQNHATYSNSNLPLHMLSSYTKTVPQQDKIPMHSPVSSNKDSPHFFNPEQSINVPVSSYQPLNLGLNNSSNIMPITFNQTHSVNSPLHYSASYSKTDQQQAKVQKQSLNNSVLEPFNPVSSEQTVSSYHPLNFTYSNSTLPSTFISTFAGNSGLPLHIPASYTKTVEQQAPKSPNNSFGLSVPKPLNHLMFDPELNKGSTATYHVYPQNKQTDASYPKTVEQQAPKSPNNSFGLSVPKLHNPFMLDPEANTGSTLTYHLYSQNKQNQNSVQEHLNYLKNVSAVPIQTAPSSEKKVNQENVVNSPSPPQKKSPAPQEIRPTTFYVPSTNMPSNVASSSSSSPSTNKTSVPATSSSFISANSSPQVVPKKKPVIVRANKSNIDNRIPVENVASTSLNTISNKTSNSTMQQTNVNQSPPKTLPIILSRSPPNQRTHNNPMPTVTMQSNVCMPNGLPVVQQVILPAGTQLPSTGQQYIFTSPQNTIRSVQLQNNAGQINQGYMKVVPQLITPASVMQMSKDGMQSFQFQTLSPNTTQAFTQVAQNPQFVNVPYVVSNQNSLSNSTTQPAVNYQPYQMPPRQMHIGGQGNG